MISVDPSDSIYHTLNVRRAPDFDRIQRHFFSYTCNTSPNYTGNSRLVTIAVCVSIAAYY